MRKVLSTILTISISFSTFVISSSPAKAAVILDVLNGILNGAHNVAVAGTLYDVEFMDGLCVGVFGDSNGVTPSLQQMHERTYVYSFGP